jgi:16S rRNA (guanine527-N7)-methyltransferase
MPSKHEQLENIAGPVSRETFERLEAFESAFLQWARRINLAAPSTLACLWERHTLDSAQLFSLAPPSATRWVDLGSGGGFPGAVLALLLRDRAEARIHLVESNGKKAAFLQTVLAKLEAPAHVHRARIEEAFSLTGPADMITARALAPLDKLLGLARPWLEMGAHGLFHKGRDYSREVEESRDRWRFDLVIHPDKIDPHGGILEIAALRSAAEALPAEKRIRT